MAKRQETIPARVKCGRSRKWLASQTAEYREMILRYLAMPEYKHLCPCPKANGGWSYRIECLKCMDAIREEA